MAGEKAAAYLDCCVVVSSQRLLGVAGLDVAHLHHFQECGRQEARPATSTPLVNMPPGEFGSTGRLYPGPNKPELRRRQQDTEPALQVNGPL